MTAWTKQNLGELEDMAPKSSMGEVLEGRFAKGALELEQTGISHQHLKPGKRLPFGHVHSVQEEIYVVLSGSGEMKVGDEMVALGGRLDALRVAPGAWRGVQAGPDGLELLAFGAPATEESDADMDMEWWPSDAA
jgi:quercetin dioxygenase-like cupin family protein